MIEETMFIRTTHRSKSETTRSCTCITIHTASTVTCEKCQKEGINFAIPFGYSQFTNHSLEPNAGLVHDYQRGPLPALTALRPDIKEG